MEEKEEDKKWDIESDSIPLVPLDEIDSEYDDGSDWDWEWKNSEALRLFSKTLGTSRQFSKFGEKNIPFKRTKEAKFSGEDDILL
jgi:hypothetical protein